MFRKPLLCLVTARRRVCDGCDEAMARRCLVDQAKQAIDAGIDLIQIREPDLEGAALFDIVSEVVSLARSSSARVIVNDRLDVAIAAGAAGVHLPGRSMPPAAARRLAPPGFLIGRSVHREDDESVTSDAVDYLIAGTVFPTASKPDAARLIGEDGLSAIVRAARCPVLAIGGLTLDAIPRVARGGAFGIAAIGLFMGDRGPCRAVPLRDTVAAVRAAFDTPQAGP